MSNLSIFADLFDPESLRGNWAESPPSSGPNDLIECRNSYSFFFYILAKFACEQNKRHWIDGFFCFCLFVAADSSGCNELARSAAVCSHVCVCISFDRPGEMVNSRHSMPFYAKRMNSNQSQEDFVLNIAVNHTNAAWIRRISMGCLLRCNELLFTWLSFWLESLIILLLKCFGKFTNWYHIFA